MTDRRGVGIEDMAARDDKSEDVTQVAAVYHGIREAILDGRYAPGTPLRLRMLVGDHGGSHIPIREALRRLESERLVENIPNRGARVAPLSLDHLDDLYATRIALEVDAVRRALENMTPKDLKRLIRLADELNEAFASGDTERAVEAHRRLHFGIYDLAESEWLNHLISILWNQSDRYRSLATPRRSLVEISAEHRAIIDGLARGDADAAGESLRLHLGHTASVVRESFALPPQPM